LCHRAYKKPKDWSWGKNKSLVWLATHNINKYLGFCINYNMPQKEKVNKILQLFWGKLIVWRLTKLSLATRILVANHI
jgi:hypothetical protein